MWYAKNYRVVVLYFLDMPTRKPIRAALSMADADIAVVRIVPETSFKNKA
jgi:hypothetical protein